MVGSGRFKMLFEFAGDAAAFREAEHAERTSEFVGYAGSFLLNFGRQRVCRGLVEQGEALENLGLTALPQGRDQLLRRRLLGFVHGYGYRRDSKLFGVSGDTFLFRSEL